MFLVSHGVIPCSVELALGYMLVPVGGVGALMLIRAYVVDYARKMYHSLRKKIDFA